jgi:hypothetical protein
VGHQVLAVLASRILRPVWLNLISLKHHVEGSVLTSASLSVFNTMSLALLKSLCWFCSGAARCGDLEIVMWAVDRLRDIIQLAEGHNNRSELAE